MTAGLTAAFTSLYLSKLCVSHIVSREMSCTAPMSPSSVVTVKKGQCEQLFPLSECYLNLEACGLGPVHVLRLA